MIPLLSPTDRRALEGATMRTEWIDVNDRLPVNGEDVLWQPRRLPGGPCEVPVIGYLSEWRDTVRFGTPGLRLVARTQTADLAEFTHWMEIPDAPDDAERKSGREGGR